MNHDLGTLLYASDFGPEYDFISNSQDLEPVNDYCPDHDISAALLLIGDGDYSEIWVTESSRPFSTSAEFERVL